MDLDARIVERWLPADARPDVLDGVLVWAPIGEQPALEIDLAAYFARVMDGG